jgi:hypothetical protein
LTATGGTAAYTFDWGGAIVTEDRNGLSAGTYAVTVTDANGCSTMPAAIYMVEISSNGISKTMRLVITRK